MNVTFTQVELVGFGLNLAGMAVSMCGCIATFYIVKHFKSILPISLLLMNVFSVLNLLLTAVNALGFPETFIVMGFFSWIVGILSIEFFMIQILFRIWMLPKYSRIANIIQWVIASSATLVYSALIICAIPSSLDDTLLTCGNNLSLIFSIGAFLALALEIGNSLYVMSIITIQKHYSNKSGEYFDFAKRRLPILLINVGLSIVIIIFSLLGNDNSYDIADFIFSFILFLSIYYFIDFKDFVLINAKTPLSGANISGNHASDHARVPSAKENPPTAPETGELELVTLDGDGNIVTNVS